MIYPTINDLSHGEYNRYEIALATAKCARMITNEYVRQRKEAEHANAGSKEGEKPITAMIDREVRDEKAVKIAIGRIDRGDYRIVHKDPEEQEREERAILEGMQREPEPYYFTADDREDREDLGDDTMGDETSYDETSYDETSYNETSYDETSYDETSYDETSDGSDDE